MFRWLRSKALPQPWQIEADAGAVAGGMRERAELGRSLPRFMTPPIDNAIIDATVPAAPGLVAAGVTPNMVSILGGVLSVGALVALWYDHLVAFVVLFGAAYVMDTVDGWMARTFAMTSDWGEILDHGKDILITILLIVVLAVRVLPSVPATAAVLVAILYLVSLAMEGCTQRTIAKRKVSAGGDPGDNIIDGFGCMCPPGADIETTRFAATPTFLAAMAMVLLAAAAYRSGQPGGRVWPRKRAGRGVTAG